MATANQPTVFIVESPSSSDLLDGRTEGRTLCSFLRLAGIEVVYNLVTNRPTLLTALHQRFADAALKHGTVPILHFSLHGNQDGIGLTDASFIEWKEFAGLLRPLNQAANGELIVALSACSGSSAWMSAFTNQTLPMKTLVSTKGTPLWQEAAVAFVVFYHHLLNRQALIKDAVEAMRQASGHGHFTQVQGEVIQQLYSKLVHEWTPEQQRQFIEAVRALQQNDEMR